VLQRLLAQEILAKRAENLLNDLFQVIVGEPRIPFRDGEQFAMMPTLDFSKRASRDCR
jgi:hypothetical protein